MKSRNVFGQVALVFLFSCVGARAYAIDHIATANLIVEKHIRPGYAGLASETAKLQRAVENLCSYQQPDDLLNVREQFKNVVVAWSRVEHIRFGPISYENRAERFLFWPDRKGRGRKQISRAVSKRDPALTDVETLQKKSVALQGLGALEYVLYGKFADKLLEDTATGDFRCNYALAIATNLKYVAEKTSSAWAKGESFPNIFSDPGTHNAVYRFPDEVSAEVIGSFILGAQLVVRKLTFVHRAYARKTKGAPFERSELTISNISRNVTSIYEIQDCCGIGELFSAKFVEDYNLMQKELAASAPQLDRELQTILSKKWDKQPDEDVMASLGQINRSLVRALKLTAEGMAKALNISKKFNSLDGD